MTYHLAGAVNVAFFALSLVGLGFQLAEIWERRARLGGASGATAILSQNQLGVSFLTYFAFFTYGYCVEPFNHYLVWPRLAGALLALAILFELARDRRSAPAVGVFAGAAALLVAGVAFLVVGPRVSLEGRVVSQGLAVTATALLMQGYAHQILLIRRSGITGAVSLRMHVLTLLKDVSTAVFGLAMGLGSGWPLVLMGGSATAIRSVLLWQFRWARSSPLAESRRGLASLPID